MNHTSIIRTALNAACSTTSALVLSAALSASLVASTARADDHAPDSAELASFDQRWRGWVAIDGANRDGADGTGSSAGGLTLFAPITQSADSLLFTELRAQIRQDGPIGGSATLGWRNMGVSGFNFGIWAGADAGRTDADADADDRTNVQISGSLEAISERFEARINGHLPLTSSRKTETGVAVIKLSGSQITLANTQDAPLYGVDAELGTRLNFDSLDNLSPISLGLYGGGYHFDSEDALEPVTGYKLRAALEFNDLGPVGSRLTAHYAYSDDTYNGPQHQAGLSFRIPLGSISSNASSGANSGGGGAGEFSTQYGRMTGRLERRNHVQLALSKEHELVEDALTGVAFDRVAYAGQSITDTSIAAGDNSLIIANEAISGANIGQELQGNQTLIGGGTTIQMRGRTTGTTAGFTAPGARGSITNISSVGFNDTIGLRLLGSNTHVAGLEIAANGYNSIGVSVKSGTGGTNIHIVNNDITTTGTDYSYGIEFGSDYTNVQIRNNRLQASADFLAVGIWIYPNGRDIGIVNNHIKLDAISLNSPGAFELGIQTAIVLLGGMNNVLISNNDIHFGAFSSTIIGIAFTGDGTTLAPGGTGNTLTRAVTTANQNYQTCSLGYFSGFIGTFDITVDGVLQTFTDGDNCTLV